MIRIIKTSDKKVTKQKKIVIKQKKITLELILEQSDEDKNSDNNKQPTFVNMIQKP